MEKAIVLAAAACCCTAASSVCQRMGAKSSPASGFAIGLVFRLARRPVWLLGIAFMIAGFVFQLAALRFGPLALVQPILAAELLLVADRRRQAARPGTPDGPARLLELPAGLQESEQLPEPIYTPSTKAEVGHDEAIDFAQTVELVGGEALAAQLRDVSIAVYSAVAAHARERGVADCMVVDMGGTSYDASVVSNGEVTITREGEIDRNPIALPMTEIRGASGRTAMSSEDAVDESLMNKMVANQVWVEGSNQQRGSLVNSLPPTLNRSLMLNGPRSDFPVVR